MSIWTRFVIALHHEERMARTAEWAARRQAMRHANATRLATAQALIELALNRNADFMASRHLIETAVANLTAAIPDALTDR